MEAYRSSEISRLLYFLEIRLVESGEVVILTLTPPPSERFVVLVSVRGSVNLRTTLWLCGLGKEK
jgi:hypothetical protein